MSILVNYIMEMTRSNQMRVAKISTDYVLANFLTKELGPAQSTEEIKEAKAFNSI